MVCRKVYKKMTYGNSIGRSLLPYTGSIKDFAYFGRVRPLP